MLPSARRLSPAVPTDRFQWQRTGPQPVPGPPRPVALMFTQVSAEPASVNARHDVEARELQLPSVLAERLAEIERQALAEGRARGEQIAEAEASREFRTTAAGLATIISEISDLRRGILHRTERQVVQLALAIAERIVHHQLELNPDLLLVIAMTATQRLGERAAAVVHLNPADFEVLAGRANVSSTLTLSADPAVGRGGCVIKSAFGEIDAGIEAQIRELSREFLGSEDEELLDGLVANF
ncbi:MAG: FliH/SctL family protein [Vicinamibacterales bacterium]